MKANRRTPPCRAFTIIELLIVVGIIIILLSIIIVAVNAAVRTSQGANTQALMSSINKGLVQFRTDMGYLPPVLAPSGAKVSDVNAFRNYAPPPEAPLSTAKGIGPYLLNVQNWYSYTTLPEYLLGYGSATEVGAGAAGESFPDNLNDPPLGIRHPGPDGYWGVANSLPDCVSTAAAGTFAARKAFLGEAPMCRPHSERFRQGRIYGPYIELKDDRLLAAIVGVQSDGSLQLAFPGEAGYDSDAPRVIVDYWGQPIRYYRNPYMPGMPHQNYRHGLGRRVPTLSDVFVLRPFRPREAIDVLDAPDASGVDTTTTTTLNAGSFAIFSSGPDRQVNQDYRADPLEYNRDNMVEIGR